MGTAMRGPGAVLWTWQVCDIALACLGVGVAFTELSFMLVPLTMAYFLTYLMAPLMDLLEKRPMMGTCKQSAPYMNYQSIVYETVEGTTIFDTVEEDRSPPDGKEWSKKVLVDGVVVNKYDGEVVMDKDGEPVKMFDAKRNVVWETEIGLGNDAFFEMETNADGQQVRKKDRHGNDIRLGGTQKLVKELLLLGKLPHTLACVMTLLLTVFVLYILFSIIGGSFAEFATKEEAKVARGEKSMSEKLNIMGNDIVDHLERQEGFVIIRDRDCPKRNISDTVVKSQVQDTLTIDSTLFADGVTTPTCKKVLCANTSCVDDVRTYDPVRFRCRLDLSKLATAGCMANQAAAAYCSGEVASIDFPTADATELVTLFQAMQTANAGSDAAAKTAKLTALQAKLKIDELGVKTDISVGVKIVNFIANVQDTLPNCTKVPVFGAPDAGMPWGEFIDTVMVFVAFMNDFILVILLAVYILLERPEGQTMGGDHRVMIEVENLINDYIILKTALSFGTGVITAAILLACRVPLAMVFGLLAFLLNYIPNVGSILAMMCPVPILLLAPYPEECDGKTGIMLSDCQNEAMTGIQRTIAFCGPAAVQFYVGNALEPAVFGSKLNLTEMSVLLGLVFFSGLWLLPGAVLSVPFLGIMKIVCHHTEHPVAKHFLGLVRADDAFA